MTSKTIDGVSRELLSDVFDELTDWNTPVATKLRALLEAPEAPRQEPVAFLDIGAGGYVDLGTDQPIEVLEKLPYGRHILGVIGTYGADGWQASVKQQVPDVEPVAYAVFADSGNIRIWSRSAEVVEMISGHGKAVPLYTSPPAPLSPDHSGGGAGVVLPEGWKAVPIEPTELMIHRGDQNYSWSVAKIYKAMIEDAPSLDKVKELNQ